MGAAIETGDMADDRLRWFEPGQAKRAGVWLGLIFIGLVTGTTMVWNHVDHHDNWLAYVALSPLPIGQSLWVLYAITVKVKVDKHSVQVSSLYRTRTFPIADIVELAVGQARDGAFLAIKTSARFTRLSTSLFTQAQLDDMRATLIARGALAGV